MSVKRQATRTCHQSNIAATRPSRTHPGEWAARRGRGTTGAVVCKAEAVRARGWGSRKEAPPEQHQSRTLLGSTRALPSGTTRTISVCTMTLKNFLDHLGQQEKRAVGKPTPPHRDRHRRSQGYVEQHQCPTHTHTRTQKVHRTPPPQNPTTIPPPAPHQTHPTLPPTHLLNRVPSLRLYSQPCWMHRRRVCPSL